LQIVQKTTNLDKITFESMLIFGHYSAKISRLNESKVNKVNIRIQHIEKRQKLST